MSSNDIEGNSAVHNVSVYQSESTTVAKFTNSLYRSCFYNRLAWPITEPICLFLVKFANALVAYSVQQLDAVALCRNELLWCLVNERQKHLFRSLYVEKLNSNNVPRLQSFRSITSWVVYFIIFINSFALCQLLADTFSTVTLLIGRQKGHPASDESCRRRGFICVGLIINVE